MRTSSSDCQHDGTIRAGWNSGSIDNLNDRFFVKFIDIHCFFVASEVPNSRLVTSVGMLNVKPKHAILLVVGPITTMGGDATSIWNSKHKRAKVKPNSTHFNAFQCRPVTKRYSSKMWMESHGKWLVRVLLAGSGSYCLWDLCGSFLKIIVVVSLENPQNSWVDDVLRAFEAIKQQSQCRQF